MILPVAVAARRRKEKATVTAEDHTQAAMSLHPEVIIHLHGALTRDGVAVTVIVTVIATENVTDTGAVNERAVVDEEDQSIGLHRAIVIRAGKGEDLNPDLDLIHPWKKNMESGKRHFYMDPMMSI